MIRAVLFDLDETLVPEAAAWEAAFNLTCASAARLHHLDLKRLRQSVFESALQLWEASPVIEYCRRMGIDSPSSLLSEFPGAGNELAYLRSWAPHYRRQAWAAGLKAVGVPDSELAGKFAESFKALFGTLHKPFADVEPTLDQLVGKRLGILTNGPSDLQRTKIDTSGLGPSFNPVLISTELGIGKPDPRIFEFALERMGVEPRECVMVGDSLERDVQAASTVGIPAVLLKRSNPDDMTSRYAAFGIPTLEGLPRLLEIF
jgi:putative hydrolase of the HAD superfamily